MQSARAMAAGILLTILVVMAANDHFASDENFAIAALVLALFLTLVGLLLGVRVLSAVKRFKSKDQQTEDDKED